MNSLQTSLVALTLATAAFAGSAARGAEHATPPRPPAAIAPLPLPPEVERHTVRLRMRIDAAGCPQKITVLSICDPVVESRLVAAVAKWKFTPATENGRAIAADVVLPLVLRVPPAHAAVRR